MELLPLLKEELARGAGRQLIVLHTYGSHFSYNDRYPEDFARFVPYEYTDASLAAKDRLDNAYDNTILYTAAMLDSVASCLRSSGAEAAMVYASDHGEDIFDDDRHLFLHASPVPSRWQIDVPMIVWISDPMAARHPAISTPPAPIGRCRSAPRVRSIIPHCSLQASVPRFSIRSFPSCRGNIKNRRGAILTITTAPWISTLSSHDRRRAIS